MHIGRHIIQELSLQLGTPVVERWSFDMTQDEFERLQTHAVRGRTHDVTPVIVDADKVVAIRKPSYPKGAFRLPSGGIHPEEAFLDGARREAYEETGLRVTIEKYLLRAHVLFRYGRDEAGWTTHVVLARPSGGALLPMDTREIAEARWVSWGELIQEIGPILRSTGRGGLAYRAELHERTSEIVKSGK